MARLVPGDRLATGVAVFAAVLGIALAGGGYSDLALGIGTMTVWAALLLTILAGRITAAAPRPATCAAALLLLALLALTVLSLSWTTDDGAAFSEAVRLAGYLGAFLLAGLAARDSRIGPAMAGLAVGVVAVALVALGSRLLGIGDGDIELVATLPTASGRLSFPVGYWNALGALAALGLPVLCWLSASAGERWVRGLALAGFAPLLLAAYMTSSRGALIAAVVGLAVAVTFAADRRRSAAVALVGVAAAVPAVAAATIASGILDTGGDGSPGRPEALVLLALGLGAGAVLLAGARLADALAAARFFDLRIRIRTLLLGIAAAATLLIVGAGPSALIGDLRSGTDGDAESGRTTGIATTSGSGRAQFWSTALDAYATEPVRGVGAGGYEAYWSQNGNLSNPARNAHSEPLEVLAELGPLGLACLLLFFFVVLGAGVRASRGDVAAPSAAALGVVASGLVGFLIDWTWQFPAVAVPVLIAAGLLTGVAPAAAGSRLRLPHPPARTVALGAVLVAVPALWAGGVLAVSISRLEASVEALEAGRLDESAAAARSAAAIVPWSSEPWLQLAKAEQAADNLPAAATAARAAIDRAPEDLRPWVLAIDLQLELGNVDAAVAYGTRALLLSPSD